MSKLYMIDTCNLCDWIYCDRSGPDWSWVCRHDSMDVPRLIGLVERGLHNVAPDWCPLPDAPEPIKVDAAMERMEAR